MSKFGIQNQKSNTPKNTQQPPTFYLNILPVGATEVGQIPAHPAGACLETMLSFFLSNLNPILKTADGTKFITDSMINTIMCVSSLLSNALAIESNCRDFDQVIRASQITTLLEGVLSGAEENIDYVLKSVHELLISSLSIEAPELMVLAFEMLQVCVRLLIKLSLNECIKNLSPDNDVVFSMSPDVIKSIPLYMDCITEDLRPKLRDICDNCYDPVHEVCLVLLNVQLLFVALWAFLQKWLCAVD